MVRLSGPRPARQTPRPPTPTPTPALPDSRTRRRGMVSNLRSKTRGSPPAPAYGPASRGGRRHRPSRSDIRRALGPPRRVVSGRRNRGGPAPTPRSMPETSPGAPMTGAGVSPGEPSQAESDSDSLLCGGPRRGSLSPVTSPEEEGGRLALTHFRPDSPPLRIGSVSASIWVHFHPQDGAFTRPRR